MRILVCGDRNWDSYEIIARELMEFPDGTIVIEGEAKGADTIGRLVAEALGFEVLKFPADWNLHGKAAGPIRNSQMLKEGKPDLVLAFHPDLSKSRGTKNMVTIALRAGVEVRVISK